MSGKGMKPIVGYNPPLYRENFPFPERKTASQWAEELDIILYGEMGVGQRMTETEFREGATKVGFVYRTEGPKTSEPNQA